MVETGIYYVYALKDPRTNPARTFYIGKGTGTRAWEHDESPDQTAKGRRICEIQASGLQVLPTVIVEGLSEVQALRIEAELISGFGTEATGGPLTNAVVPSGNGKSRGLTNVVVPQGLPEKAQLGLQLLKSALLELAKANEGGITNGDAARALWLRSDYGGGAKDYLTYSVLGILMREGRVERVNRVGRGGRHFAKVR